MKLTDHEENFLNLMLRYERKEHTCLTAGEIAERGPGIGTVRRVLAKMEANGLVEKWGSNFQNARTWRVTEAGRSALSPTSNEKE